MYRFIFRPLLFLIDPEKAHHFTLNIISLIYKIPKIGELFRFFFQFKDPRLERVVFGIKFNNPIGLAAGFDKDAKFIKEFSNFGFGFIEIGTLTPRAQTGNSKKRVFRLTSDSALVNRLGFNNDGVDAAIKKIKRVKGIIIGGNIGKNKDTPNSEALNDYKYCFIKLHPYVDYFAINLSSPNTEGLRELQEKKNLRKILSGLKKLNLNFKIQKPILLKIDPDLNDDQLTDVIDVVKETKIDGVIASNTTTKRINLKSDINLVSQKGGLSGKPLSKRSTEIINFLHKKSNGSFPIIGVGGVHSPDDAIEKIRAGASLVQLYTGFIYEGPFLIKKINKAIVNEMNGFNQNN